MDMVLIIWTILSFFQIICGNCIKITTDQTNYHGTIKQYGYSNVSVFLGIPFAKPPVGLLRFEPPQEIQPKMEDIDAHEFKPSCLQDKGAFLNSFLPISRTTSEDCLYLNIYVPIPETETTTGQKVMIWIHGGGFQYGSGNVFDGFRMATESNAIVVTINYRLGVFGFFSGSSTARNFGLLDQNMALKWVHKYIHYFGGDPEKVTLIGEDSGGSSVCLHIISPLSQGLFSSAISHGGLDFSRVIHTNPQVNSHILMAASECINNVKHHRIECLRNLDGETLLKLTQNENMFDAFTPTIDYKFLPSDPMELFERQNYNQVPYLIGLAEPIDQVTSNHSENTENLRSKFLSEAQNLSPNHSQLVTETLYYLLLSFYNLPHQTPREGKTESSYSEMLKAKTTSQFLRIAKQSSKMDDTFLYTYDQDDVQSESTLERIKSIWMSFIQSGQPSDLGINFPSINASDKYLEIKHNESNIRNITDILPENEQLLWFKVLPNILNILPPVRYDGIDTIKHAYAPGQMQDNNQVFLTEWGMTRRQVESLLISAVLALLFVCVICLGLVRILLNPPVVKSQLNSKNTPVGNDYFIKQSYDNDAFTNSNRESVTSIELKDSKNQFLTKI